MPMPSEMDLAGLTTDRWDDADAHRRGLYRDYFELSPDEPALAFHWLLFTGLPPQTRPDGHAVAMPPFPEMPFPRRMWAGGEIGWHTPIAGDVPLHRRSTVSIAEVKHGSAGEFLLTSLTHVVSQAGDVRIEERQDIVFLQAATRPGTAPPRPAPFVPVRREERTFDPVDLFRYSALTLNSHRIHYDADYARDVEGYRGIVVHGPLLASTLIHAGYRWRPDRSPASFRYRAVAPSIAGERLAVIGAEGDDGALSLAIVGADDDLRMTATMIFGDPR